MREVRNLFTGLENTEVLRELKKGNWFKKSGKRGVAVRGVREKL